MPSCLHASMLACLHASWPCRRPQPAVPFKLKTRAERAGHCPPVRPVHTPTVSLPGGREERLSMIVWKDRGFRHKHTSRHQLLLFCSLHATIRHSDWDQVWWGLGLAVTGVMGTRSDGSQVWWGPGLMGTRSDGPQVWWGPGLIKPGTHQT